MPKKMSIHRHGIIVATLVSFCLLSSCKKYYSCTCTHDGKVHSVLRASEEMRKKEVEKDCQELEDSYNASGFSSTCEVDKMKFEKI